MLRGDSDATFALRIHAQFHEVLLLHGAPCLLGGKYNIPSDYPIRFSPYDAGRAHLFQNRDLSITALKLMFCEVYWNDLSLALAPLGCGDDGFCQSCRCRTITCTQYVHALAFGIPSQFYPDSHALSRLNLLVIHVHRKFGFLAKFEHVFKF